MQMLKLTPVPPKHQEHMRRFFRTREESAGIVEHRTYSAGLDIPGLVRARHLELELRCEHKQLVAYPQVVALYHC